MPHRLISIDKPEDIPAEYRQTPVGLFLEYHNLGRTFENYTQAQLLVGMCMDSRKHLRIPDNFAFILRAGGANLRYAEFNISYAIALGGVRHIAVIGHTECGMQGLDARRESFVKGLVENAGWSPEQATDHYFNFCTMFEIGNAVEFVISEAHRLNHRYPKVNVIPLFFKIEDGRIYGVREK